MGCGIHPVLEQKWTNPSTNKTAWVGIHAYPYVTIPEIWKDGEVVKVNHWHSPRPQQRNYALFAKLAGVRGEGPDPRGLPDDISPLALMELGDNGELHSHSWATAREWVEACLSLERDPEKLFLTPDNTDPRVKDPYRHYLDIDYIDERGGPESFRIVFAFDN
jgi:hypothetical protein